MADHRMTDAEVAQAFADHLDKLSETYRHPLPGAKARLAKIIDEHEAECIRMEREEITKKRDRAAQSV